ncbi:hypothetical protein GLYMA_11G025650v4 [Glycine max]|nr:hypothetical protein GLYMA_11G025650v4 [Glycine max]KAH1157235.1 hypothetical protein GYH30_029824 [Glycine max]
MIILVTLIYLIGLLRGHAPSERRSRKRIGIGKKMSCRLLLFLEVSERRLKSWSG